MQVSCGFQHVVCRTSKGKAYAWGKGERGQLGTGTYAYPHALSVSLILTGRPYEYCHTHGLDTVIAPFLYLMVWCAVCSVCGVCRRGGEPDQARTSGPARPPSHQGVCRIQPQRCSARGRHTACLGKGTGTHSHTSERGSLGREELIYQDEARPLGDPCACVWLQFQGLEVKSEGGVVSVALYQDQLLPRPVSLAVPVLDVECAHFHTALLVQEDVEDLGEQQGLGMLMFGMAASTRLQSPEPTPVPLPVAPTAQPHPLKLLPACMSQTALHCPWTPSPYLRGYEGPNDDSQWVCEEGQGQVQGTVVGVSTGLAHKLLLVQEAP